MLASTDEYLFNSLQDLFQDLVEQVVQFAQLFRHETTGIRIVASNSFQLITHRFVFGQSNSVLICFGSEFLNENEEKNIVLDLDFNFIFYSFFTNFLNQINYSYYYFISFYFILNIKKFYDQNFNEFWI